MKNFFIVFGFLLTVIFTCPQDLATFKLYKPGENAAQGIAAAMKDAKAGNKHVFIQMGNNSCIWCARFNDFVTNDRSIDSLMHVNYVVYHLNYSVENYNTKLLAKYGYPQRFGFPVFLVLDAMGNLIHTQNSEYLEQDKGYSKDKVTRFFNDWGPKALDPKQYQNQ